LVIVDGVPDVLDRSEPGGSEAPEPG